MKLKKHHRDKYGRPIEKLEIKRKFDPRRLHPLNRLALIKTIKDYLIANNMTEFVQDGKKYILSEDKLIVEDVNQ